MKQLIYSVVILLFLFSSLCLAGERIPITAHNDSKLTKTFWFRWMNNPAGCYVDIYGRLHCEYDMWVSETKAGSKHVHTVKNDVGDKYCMEWENTEYNLRTEESSTNLCFKIEEDIESIYITPEKVVIKKKEKKIGKKL